MARRSLDCFLAQTYPYRQIVIADDREDPSFDWTTDDPVIPGLTYVRLDGRMPIWQKRNFCCDWADGEIIAHWDSDDWSAPTRIEDQVERLEESGKAVTGYHSMFFHRDEPEAAFWYRGYPNDAIGTSLMFTKDWWKAHPFKRGKDIKSPNVGEDTGFSNEARDDGQITTVEAGMLMVATIHRDNTSIKHIDATSVEYCPLPIEALPAEFFEHACW